MELIPRFRVRVTPSRTKLESEHVFLTEIQIQPFWWKFLFLLTISRNWYFHSQYKLKTDIFNFFEISVKIFRYYDFDQNHYLYLASTDGLSSICPPVHFRGPHGWMDGWTVRRRPSSSVEVWFVFILRSSIENFVFLTRNDLWYKVLLSAAPSLVMVDFWQFLYRVQYTKRMFGKLSNI